MSRLPLAVFDLDETLTRKDTYIPYLITALKQRPTRLLRCMVLPVYATAFFLRVRDNTWLKERFLRVVLKGLDESQLDQINSKFIASLIPSGLNQTMLDKLEQHRTSGDQLVLLSASLDCYVVDIGKALGFDKTIATAVEIIDGRITGKLAGPNLKGSEKVWALEQYLERDRAYYDITAYGDHLSDQDILAWGDRGYWIQRTTKLESVASIKGIKFL